MNQALVSLKAQLLQAGLGQRLGAIDPLLSDHHDMGAKYRKALSSYPPLNYENQRKVDKMVKGIDRATSAGMDRLVEDLQRDVARQFAKQKEETR